MIKTILRSLAYRILDKELRHNWIHRSFFNEYTQWMSRDFPVMNDTHDFFKDRPYGGTGGICRHREDMARKHKYPQKTP